MKTSSIIRNNSYLCWAQPVSLVSIERVLRQYANANKSLADHLNGKPVIINGEIK